MTEGQKAEASVITLNTADQETSLQSSVDKPTYERILPVNGQIVDHITFETIPRYKESGASGDEWRYSVCVKLFYKGHVVKEKYFRDTITALNNLKKVYDGYAQNTFGNRSKWKRYCDQEGCREKWTKTLKLKNLFCRECGTKETPYSGNVLIRRFCDRHSGRGDCALEDCNDNYEVIEVPDDDVDNGSGQKE